MRFWSAFMMVGWVAVPLFVLYNLPNYRGGKGPHRLMLRQQAAAEGANEEG